MTETTVTMIRVDPDYQLLPTLEKDDLEQLRQSIREVGVLVPVIIDEDGRILDGHHRFMICKELGIECPVTDRAGLSEKDKRDLIVRVNLARRHLSLSQKRDLIRTFLREDPMRSNRELGALIGVSDVTVGAQRAELEATAQIEHTVRPHSRTDDQSRAGEFTRDDPGTDIADHLNMIESGLYITVSTDSDERRMRADLPYGRETRRVERNFGPFMMAPELQNDPEGMVREFARQLYQALRADPLPPRPS